MRGGRDEYRILRVRLRRMDTLRVRPVADGADAHQALESAAPARRAAKVKVVIEFHLGMTEWVRRFRPREALFDPQHLPMGARAGRVL